MDRIPHPHYATCPARMSDGRLFTNYSPNCDVPEDRARVIETGEQRRALDRSAVVLRAGSYPSNVDTMVPELVKRVYAWNGPLDTRASAQPAGIGTGRMFLPGRPDLMRAGTDPDAIAAATFEWMPSTFSSNPSHYTTSSSPLSPSLAQAVLPPRHNRYSAPYGN